ncbi:MAG TPA: 30S ribosomal protein S19, partial [Candidatus Fimenecus sp.]|nr:30S ribosomal protein S19 [Candidatus Fimenecus sp.]
MSRSTKKGPYVAPKLLRKVEEMNKQFEILIKIAEKQKDSIIINII